MKYKGPHISSRVLTSQLNPRRTTITLDQYYQCIGLIAAGKEEARRTDSIQEAFIDIVGKDKGEDAFWDLRYEPESTIKGFSEFCKNKNIKIKNGEIIHAK